MASIINASTAGVGGVITTADNSGILNLQTGGTTAVTIDASQNVGIGTASPASALFVSANTATGGVPEINLENSQNFEAANYLNYKTELIFRGDKQNRYSSAGAILGPLASIATIYSNPTLTADSAQGAGALTFSTRAATATTSSDTLTERMRIDSAGRIVSGGDIYLGGAGVYTASEASIVYNSNGDLILNADPNNISASSNLRFEVDNTESMRITSGGDLGVGTTDPTGGYAYNSAARVIGISGDASASTSAYGVLNLINNRATPSATDNLGLIGFTSPNSVAGQTLKAYIVGATEGAGGVTGGFGGNIRFHTKPDNSTTQATERMRISSTGIVTMSAYGAGAATFSAAGVISSVSDETWKTKDGVPLNPDAMLQKLEPGYWYYNEEKAPIFGAERQLGFYAQNVNEAIGVEAAPIPEEGKPWGYYDRSVLAVTVMSLQKALATIESLTAAIQEQQALITSLTARLDALENK